MTPAAAGRAPSPHVACPRGGGGPATPAVANVHNRGVIGTDGGICVDSMSPPYAPPSPTPSHHRQSETVSRGDCTVAKARPAGLGEGETEEREGGGVGEEAMEGVDGGAEFVEATTAMEELIKKFDNLAEMLDVDEVRGARFWVASTSHIGQIIYRLIMICSIYFRADRCVI